MIVKNKLATLVGLLVLAAGGLGIYLLFRQGPPAEEESEQAVETVVPVHAAQIRRMTLHDYVRAYGTIVPNPGIDNATAASVQLGSPVDGLVSEVHCVAGQAVRRGDVLFALYDEPAKLAIEHARQVVAFAEKNLQRQDKLKQVQGTSDKLYLETQQQLENARNQLQRAQAEHSLLQVQAPFDGTIMEVTTAPAQAVTQAAPLARLTDLKRLVVSAGVPVAEAARLKIGQPVEFDAVHTPTGRVDYIDQQADPDTGAVTVLAALPADTPARPGQFISVRIITAEYKDCLAVPEDSVVTTPEGETVVAVVNNDQATHTLVKRGVSEDGWVQIEGQGLQPETIVVTAGAYGLPDRTKIRLMGT